MFLLLALDPLQGAGDVVKSMLGLRGDAADARYKRVADALKLNHPFVVVPLNAASDNSAVAAHVVEAIRNITGSVVT